MTTRSCWSACMVMVQARFVDEGVVAATEKPHIVDVGGALVSVVLANVMGLAARRLGGAAGERTVTIASVSARHCCGVAVRTARYIQSGSPCSPSWMNVSFASQSRRRTRSGARVVPSV